MDHNWISESQRLCLQQHAPWPISFHTFKGERVQPSFGKEDLLELLLRRERFVCDSNSSWKEEAGKTGNESKAFIVVHTTLDEADYVYGNLFGKKVNFAFENIFFFTIQPDKITLAIERYNSQFPKRFRPDDIKRVSRERIKKTDTKYLKSECELMAQVRSEKETILSFLKEDAIDIDNLPSVEVSEPIKSDIIQYVRSASPKCFKDYQCSMNIAGLCYAALLLERDNVGNKTRSEFSDPNRRNVFGDVLLIRDALWFKARILSNDGAVRRMAEYIALPEIKVTGIV